MKQSRYKIGDKVKLLADDIEYTVKKITKEKYIYKYQIESEGAEYKTFVEEKDLSIITPKH